MDESIDSETSNKILNLITAHPGLTLSDIAKFLNIKITVLEFYLSSLVKQNKISIKESDGYIKYYKCKRKQKKDRRTKNTREVILETISKNPGIHLANIAEVHNMSNQLAQYHLRYMEKKGLINSVKKEDGYYKRYYISDGNIGVEEKQIIALLRQEQVIKIVFLILKNPNIKHKEILKEVNIVASTLSYHLNKLSEYDIIDSISYGKERGYFIKDDKKIIKIIRKYRLDNLVTGLKDSWKDMHLIG